MMCQYKGQSIVMSNDKMLFCSVIDLYPFSLFIRDVQFQISYVLPTFIVNIVRLITVL